MKPQKSDIRVMQLAHVGKLMAGLSHEFKNHLAIIRELSGLMEDLLMLEEEGSATNKELFKKNLSIIDERISQAAEMCRFLSGFAHRRMDEPLSSFDVTDVLQEEIYLLRRFAWQKQLEIIFSSEEGLPAITNDPSLLQFAVFCIVEPALESLEKDGQILFAVAPHNDAIQITVDIKGEMKKTEADIPCHDMLPEVLQLLNAEHSYSLDQNKDEKFIVTIPSIENFKTDDT